MYLHRPWVFADSLEHRLDHDVRMITGPILDVDYEMESVESSPFHQASSLQDLCGKKIVSDSFLTRKYIHFMPNEIKKFIMHKAISEGRFPTISFLLKNWPYRVFELPELPALKNWEMSCSRQNISIFVKSLLQVLESVTTMLNTFLEIVHIGGVNTELKLIDISSVPLSEKFVLKICNYISDMSHSVDVDPENSNATEKYTIKIHCTLSSRKAVDALHQALIVEKMGLSPIKLCLHGMNFTNISIRSKSKDMFFLIDPMDLQIFSLNFDSILEQRTQEMLLYLPKFHRLKVLDFAYCRLLAENFDKFNGIVRNLLRELPHISCLNFSNCYIKNHLAFILEHLPENKSVPLDTNYPPAVNKKFKSMCSYPGCQSSPQENLVYLNLSGSFLSSGDLEYLATSPKLHALKNLNLGNNQLGKFMNSLLLLLQALAPSLYVLEIGDGNIGEEQLNELFSTLLDLKKLRFLNIVNLRAPSEIQLLHLPKLCELPFLRILCLTVPRDVSPLEVSQFRTRVVNMMTSEKKNLVILWLD